MAAALKSFVPTIFDRKGFPSTPAARGSARQGWTGYLKINYAQMKSSELQMLWRLVKAGEKRPLSAAGMALLLRLRFALQEYEASVTKVWRQI